MGKLKLSQQLEGVAAAEAITRGTPLTHAIDRQNRGFLKGRGIKRRGRMRLVVFWKNDLAFVTQLFPEKFFHPEFALKPQRHGHDERLQTARCISKIGRQQPFKFDERLVIKRNIIETIRLDTACS